MLDNYADLQAAIADWVERDDLTAQIPTFIALAEARFNRIILTPEREATATLATGVTTPLPANFYGLKSIWLDTDPTVELEQMSIQELKSRWNGVGVPQNFAIQGGNTLLFGPTPDSAYGLELVYWTRIPALSVGNPTNWLLTEHPDIYLYGALVQTEQFNVNDQRVLLWKAQLDGAIGELISAGRRKQNSAAPQRIRAPYNT